MIKEWILAKIIHSTKLGYCLFYERNLLNWNICEYFTMGN